MFHLHGEAVTLGVYGPSYNPNNVYQGLEAYGHAIVGAGVEFPDIARLPNTGGGSSVAAASIDISSSGMKLTLPVSSEGLTIPNDPFNGYVLAFSGPADIVGVYLLGTDIAGIKPSNVTFNGHQIFINGSGLHLPEGEQAYANLGFRFANSP